jgi:N-acetylmuramoyl-L-alanine amidase
MAWANDQIRDRVIRTLLGESNGTPEGMTSVAHVMKNRADSGAWGDRTNGGLTRVITARKQFSMWNTDDPKLIALANSVRAIPTTDPRYQRAAAIADGVFSEQIPDTTNGATHYHTFGVHPDWSNGVTPVATIGGHYFYKLPLTASNTAGSAVTSPSMVGVGGATSAPAAAPITTAGSAPETRQAVNAALASARTMLGKNEVPDHDELMSYLHDGGQDLDPHKVAWCAAFVSAALQKAGLPVPTQVVKDSAFGPGAYAPNYLTYGNAVAPENIQAGDIIVSKDGSHVGFAEGPIRQGPNGPEVQMIAGNDKDTSGRYTPGSYTNSTTGAVANRAQVGMVGERWVPLSQYTARRYVPADSTAPAATTASATTPATSAPAASPYFIGDSIAVGLRGKTGEGDTVEGRNPKAVLDAINATPPEQLRGRPIVLSTGISNNPSDLASVQAQFDALKAKGVNSADIHVAGLGSRSDIAAASPALQKLVAQNGATYGGDFRAGADGVHPQDYGGVLASLNLGARPADVAAPQAQPVAAVAPPGSPPIPGGGQNSSAGFVGPGSDKYTLVKGMTTGTSGPARLTMAANWGNWFGGATPPASAPPASAPAATPSQPVPSDNPLAGPSGWANANPLAGPSGWAGMRPPADLAPKPPASPTPPPSSDSTAPNNSAGGKNPNYLDFRFGNPVAQGIPDSSLPGSMLSSAQNLLKLLFPPTNVG